MRAVVLAETLAVAVHVALIGCAPGGGAPWAVGVVVRRISRSVATVGCSARSVACSARSVAAVPLTVVMGVPVVLRVLLALRLSRGVTIPCVQRSITSIRRLCTVRSNVCVRALGLHIVGGVPALLRVVGL